MTKTVLTIRDTEISCLNIKVELELGHQVNPNLYQLNWLRDITWKRTGRLDVNYFNTLAKNTPWAIKFNPR